MSAPIPVTAYDHVKIALKDFEAYELYLQDLGFSPLETQSPAVYEKPDRVWGSGEAVMALYRHTHPLAKSHHEAHGDTIFDLAFVSPGRNQVVPGVGGMRHSLVSEASLPKFPILRGIQRIDHNTLNVDMGDLDSTVEDYLGKFQLERGQFFHIRTKLTGLKSWVTRSPNYGVQIPFNEATEAKSQVQEYIDVHRGPGVQHLALLSDDILATMNHIHDSKKSPMKFLDIPDTYYELAEQRVQFDENIEDLKKHRLLVDGDQSGYLLQIFTANVFGAFFFELIQRKGNHGFGEGNFQALFESIELDQKRRGVL